MNESAILDLVILVPGKDEHETFDALLSSRRHSLGIRDVRYWILVHHRRDPGCFHEAPAVLQPFQKRARRALVVFDHDGSGQEQRAAPTVVQDLKERLARSGWGERAEVLLLQPELENWVWSKSPHVDAATGWAGRTPRLRQWLRTRGWWPKEMVKPPKPKECLQEALRHVKMRRSSAIYRQLAENVSLETCSDEAFLFFRDLMRRWFPQGETT